MNRNHVIDLPPSKRNIIKFLQWFKLVFTFVIISTIFLCCSPKFSSSPISDALTRKHFNCDIPNSAEIIHYPMMHDFDFDNSLPPHVQNFLKESAVYSQFRLFQTLQESSSMHVFFEGVSESLSEENLPNRGIFSYSIGEKNNVSLDEIKDSFDEAPSYYDQLNAKQKTILLKVGGAPVAFATEIIPQIHRVATPRENDSFYEKTISIYKENQSLNQEIIDLKNQFPKASNREKKQLKNDTNRIFKQLVSKNKKLKEIVFDQREAVLKREVEKFLDKTNSNQPVFIAFGDAHDLSDEFDDYDFYVLPTDCSIPESFLSHPYYAFNLMGKADRILEQNNPTSRQTRQAEDYYEEAYDILKNALKTQNKKDEETDYWDSFFSRPYKYYELEALAQKAYKKYKGIPDEDDGLILAFFTIEMIVKNMEK